jgi:hypothetical protein
MPGVIGGWPQRQRIESQRHNTIGQYAKGEDRAPVELLQLMVARRERQDDGIVALDQHPRTPVPFRRWRGGANRLRRRIGAWSSGAGRQQRSGRQGEKCSFGGCRPGAHVMGDVVPAAGHTKDATESASASAWPRSYPGAVSDSGVTSRRHRSGTQWWRSARATGCSSPNVPCCCRSCAGTDHWWP